MPDVIARQGDVFPAQRREVAEKLLIHGSTLPAQRVNGAEIRLRQSLVRCDAGFGDIVMGKGRFGLPRGVLRPGRLYAATRTDDARITPPKSGATLSVLYFPFRARTPSCPTNDVRQASRLQLRWLLSATAGK